MWDHCSRVTAILVCWTHIVQSAHMRRTHGDLHTETLPVCDGHSPADIVFILDSSTSLWPSDFAGQLNFVIGVIDHFTISETDIRVGAISFSHWAFLDFHLKRYHSKQEVVDAILAITQIGGDTNSASAISFMRNDMFSPANGARPGVPHIAIVMTDGKSNDKDKTAREARLAREQGIHVFAIGVGREVEVETLWNIASRPEEHYVFTVDDYSALQSLSEIIAKKTCHVTVAPAMVPNVDIAVDQGCSDADLADVVLAISPHSTYSDYQTALTFFRNVSLSWDSADRENIRVALVPKSCSGFAQLNMGVYEDKEELLDTLDSLQNTQSYTQDVLKYMRMVSFAPENGARHNAKRVAILMVDDTSYDQSSAIYEAAEMRALLNVELFAVGVGKQVDPVALQALASTPVEQHVYHVGQYSDLHRIVEKLRNSICLVPGQMIRPSI